MPFTGKDSSLGRCKKDIKFVVHDEGNMMTRIGVISDTHGLLPLQVHEVLADCDWIFHAGDICDPGILRELQTIAPTVAVLGNNDFNEYGARVTYEAHPIVDEVLFFMTHKPNDARKHIATFRAGGTPEDNVPHVVIHGHTHVPALERIEIAGNPAFLVCPGSISYPRMQTARSLAKIDIQDSHVARIWVQSLEGSVVHEVVNTQ